MRGERVRTFQVQDLAALALQNGRKLDARQCAKLFCYVDLLARWNKKMNLVGPFSREKMVTDLVADSWHLADFLSTLDIVKAPVTFDLGAGAGLPGIPLRCFWPKGNYYLVEPRKKRSVFMRQALRDMGLVQTQVLNCGYQDIDASLLPADIVLSRAFCPWKEFLALSGGLAGAKGRVIVMASTAKPEEKVAGWELESTWPYKARGEMYFFWSFLRDSL